MHHWQPSGRVTLFRSLNSNLIHQAPKLWILWGLHELNKIIDVDRSLRAHRSRWSKYLWMFECNQWCENSSILSAWNLPNLFGSDEINCLRCTVSKHRHSSKSEERECGSRFSLTVLQKRIPSSCKIIDSLERSSLMRIFDMSMLSIKIWPPLISTTPKSEFTNEDLPEPLRPQMPI